MKNNNKPLSRMAMAIGLLVAIPCSVAWSATSPMTDIKRDGARDIASLLSDDDFTATLQAQLRKAGSQDGATLPLQSLLAGYSQRHGRSALTNRLQGMDIRAKHLKGHDDLAGSLLGVRLYLPKGAVLPANAKDLLVAYEPAGKQRDWTVVQAFDREGHQHVLDAHRAPDFPVLVFDIDGAKDLRAGLRLVNDGLRARGLMASVRQENPVEITSLDMIELKDDQEPWVSGSAEVFALVSGLAPDLSKPSIELVDMPYLDYDATQYTPGQDLIYWRNFGLGAANIQLMEQDDEANYKDILAAVLKGVEDILGSTVPEYSFIPKIADAILKATPDSWWLNDNDYVDSFYLVRKGQHYVNHVGASGNATVTMTPLTLPVQANATP
ncbi:DUF3103 family protein [Dyella sp.]|uniref:DUF3103 family protein n=1 Tax=Dyella sp. TaxID=1869338 RepID=UPI002ED3F75F